MAWQVIRGPHDNALGADRAEVSWGWELERDREVIHVTVTVSEFAAGSEHDLLLGDVADALATQGRSEVDRILAQVDPPRRILCSTAGCRPMALDES